MSDNKETFFTVTKRTWEKFNGSNSYKTNWVNGNGLIKLNTCFEYYYQLIAVNKIEELIRITDGDGNLEETFEENVKIILGVMSTIYQTEFEDKAERLNIRGITLFIKSFKRPNNMYYNKLTSEFGKMSEEISRYWLDKSITNKILLRMWIERYVIKNIDRFVDDLNGND